MEPVADPVPAVTAPVVEEGAPIWPWIVGGLVVVAAAAAGGVLIARRTRVKAEPVGTVEA